MANTIDEIRFLKLHRVVLNAISTCVIVFCPRYNKFLKRCPGFCMLHMGHSTQSLLKRGIK